MVKCYVCGRKFNFFGWAMHVRKEKRIHGEDIYKFLKMKRTMQNLENWKLIKSSGQMRLAI